MCPGELLSLSGPQFFICEMRWTAAACALWGHWGKQEAHTLGPWACGRSILSGSPADAPFPSLLRPGASTSQQRSQVPAFAARRTSSDPRGVHRGNSWWRRGRSRLPSPARHLLLDLSLEPACGGDGQALCPGQRKRDGVLTRECEGLAWAVRPGRKPLEHCPRSGHICLCFAVSLLWTREMQAPGRTWLRRAAKRPKPTWATWGISHRWAAGAPAEAFGGGLAMEEEGQVTGSGQGLSFFSTT